MNGQQTLLNTSADSRRVDAGVQIKDAPVLAHFSLAIDRSSEVVRRGSAVATKDELAVFNGYLDSLLAYSWHFDLQNKSVRILMKVHNRTEILNALSRFSFNWCQCSHNRVKVSSYRWLNRPDFV
jgi:hypothetical protein